MAAEGPDEPAGQAPDRSIYVNRNLRLDCIEAVGFDMDYTLARYARLHLEELAFRLTLEKLLAKGYPEALLRFRYRPAFVIRGLTVDKLLGNVLKLDRHGHPCRVYHGSTALERTRKRATYRRERIAFRPPRFAVVDTLFNLPEVDVYAQLVDYFDAQLDAGPLAPEGGQTGVQTGGRRNYAQMFDDVRAAIDEAHRDGSLKGAVRRALGRYIERDPQMVPLLRQLRASGKKVFLLTNSGWAYTDAVMSYLTAPEGSGTETETGSVAGAGAQADGSALAPRAPSWCALFDLVVVEARKPDFFGHAAALVPLAKAHPAGATPVGDVPPAGAPPAPRAPEHAYLGGSLAAVEAALGVRGEAVLYVGDHIFGDILRSKKTSLWRTALVVEELEDEVALARRLTRDVQALRALESQRLRLERKLTLQKDQLATEGRQLVPSLAQERAHHRRALADVQAQMQALEDELAAAHNPIWGAVFKEDHENSRFGEQVASYACLYMARATDLAAYPPDHYFRSPRDYLPHEPRDTAGPADWPGTAG